MLINEVVKKWFNNIRNNEELSYGGLRTLNDIEKEYDRLVEQNTKHVKKLKKYAQQITD